MADKEPATVSGKEKKHPTVSGKEKDAAMNKIVAKQRACDAASAALVEIRQALGDQFAEIGNNDKVSYSGRDGAAIPRGISDADMKAADDRIKAALVAVMDALKLL